MKNLMKNWEDYSNKNKLHYKINNIIQTKYNIIKGDQMTNINKISGFIWGIADSVLRGAYKRNEYQKVILPFTVLKRFDSVLEHSKKDVVDTYEANKERMDFLKPILMSKSVDENGRELGFYNYSRFDFKTLLEDPDNIEENIKFYINSFSSNVTDILENFDIEKQIAKLSKANLLYLLIKKFSLL